MAFPSSFFVISFIGLPTQLTHDARGYKQNRPVIRSAHIYRFTNTAVDAVGIFRKSGGKQRISHLREMIEADPGASPFIVHVINTSSVLPSHERLRDRKFLCRAKEERSVISFLLFLRIGSGHKPETV